jgi:hypothetical protein
VIDDGLPVWMGCGLLLQDLVEGLRAPVARAHVTLDEVWRETRLEDRHDGLLRDDIAIVENREEHTEFDHLPLLLQVSYGDPRQMPPLQHAARSIAGVATGVIKVL